MSIDDVINQTIFENDYIRVYKPFDDKKVLHLPEQEMLENTKEQIQEREC